MLTGTAIINAKSKEKPCKLADEKGLYLIVPKLRVTAIKLSRHTGKDAGQIGRIADLHGFAARRVRDKDVPNASRPWRVTGWLCPCLI